MPSFSETAVQKEKHTERFGQILIYLGKLFRIFINERSWKVFPIAAIVSLIVAAVCNNVFVNMEGTKVGALAFACVCVWNGFFNSIQSICKERPIIKREHRAGMYISSYIIANMIYQAFLCIGQALIQVGVYKLYGFPFPSDGPVTGKLIVYFKIKFFVITFAEEILEMMVSCIVKSTTTAMTVVPFLLILQLIFSGVAFELDGIADKFSQIMISRWGIRTICTVANFNSLKSISLYAAVNQLTKVPEISMVYKFIRNSELWTIIGETSTKSMMEDAYVYTASNTLTEWGVLLGMAILFAVIGRIALGFIDKDSR